MDFLNKYSAQALAVLRIVTGLQFLEHGTGKIFHFPYFPLYAHTVPLSWPDGAAGLLELVLGVLIVLGLFSRVAAFIASGEMAFAYFMVHAMRGPFPLSNGGDSAVCFCFIFLYIACAGPGAWAVNQK